MTQDALIAGVEELLGQRLACPVAVTERTPLAGGSISRTERITTTAGTFVLKSHPAAPAGFFEAEAAGLSALKASGTSLVIPDAVAVGASPSPFLVLEYLDTGSRTGMTDERLGIGLAELHRTRATQFGFSVDNYCGATPQPNAWTDRWIAFYAEVRLAYQVRRARNARLITREHARSFDDVIARLDGWLEEPSDGPALIHGDLWSGNLHVTTGGQPALLDPAAYYAHREAELGMMLWFGGFPARTYAAYEEVLPLEPGWRERHPLYRLYHVLNHVNLFGGSYLDEALAIVRRFT